MENCFRSSLFIPYTINFVSFLLDCRMRQPTITCGQKFERSLLTAIHYLCRRLKQWVEKMKELSHGQLLINYLVIRYRLFFESCNSFCIQINLDLWFDLFKSQLFFSLMSFWPWKRYINQLMKKALFGIQSFVKFIIQLMVTCFFQESKGIIEIGSTSTQIAFAPSSNTNLPKDYSSEVKINGKDYKIYATSYLCLGKEEFMRRYYAELVRVNTVKINENKCFLAGKYWLQLNRSLIVIIRRIGNFVVVSICSISLRKDSNM